MRQTQCWLRTYFSYLHPDVHLYDHGCKELQSLSHNDVARQLFAKMGVENTTMNDIALASKKGRRTLYTYFKSKDEIYLAVVESELDILSDMMKRVAEKNISPDEKLLEMIYTRLDAVKEADGQHLLTWLLFWIRS